MPAFKVSANIAIDASVERVRDVLCNYKTWPTWSPWLYLEPDTQVNYHGEPSTIGHGYDWNGDRTGSGKMTLRSITDTRIESDLNFLKPFKSYADIAFDLKANGDNSTEVVWHMDSSLPFFMFFMVGKMQGMIHSDYTRGLRMLKDYVESGAIHSKTQVEGVVTTEPLHYIGVEDRTSMSTIGDSMEANFPVAYKSASENQGQIIGAPIAIYHKVDLTSGSCHYTAAMPMSADASDAKTLASTKALKVIHTGAYRHLGNAWSKAMSEIQHTAIKANKKAPPYEQYMNDPDDTPEDQLITEIYIPLK